MGDLSSAISILGEIMRLQRMKKARNYIAIGSGYATCTN